MRIHLPIKRTNEWTGIKKNAEEENRRVDIGRCDFEIYPFSDRNADNWNASTQASAQVCWRPDFLTPSTTIKHSILICSINWLLSARTALNSDVNLQFRIRFLVFQTRNLPLHPWEHPYLIIQCDTNIVSFFSRIVSNKLLSTSFFKNLFCFLSTFALIRVLPSDDVKKCFPDSRFIWFIVRKPQTHKINKSFFFPFHSLRCGKR